MSELLGTVSADAKPGLGAADAGSDIEERMEEELLGRRALAVVDLQAACAPGARPH